IEKKAALRRVDGTDEEDDAMSVRPAADVTEKNAAKVAGRDVADRILRADEKRHALWRRLSRTRSSCGPEKDCGDCQPIHSHGGQNASASSMRTKCARCGASRSCDRYSVLMASFEETSH